MKCFRFDVRRNFLPYLDGELDSNAVKRVEGHLIDCGPCRTRLAHLRNGHRFARELPRFAPARDPWESIEAAIDGRHEVERRGANWRELVFRPGYALGVIGVIALIAALLVAIYRPGPTGELLAEALDLSEFHAVSIADIEQNQKPHVMAEGYVAEVRVDERDGDLRFKLVDDLGRPGPFIVCEIIDPIKLKAPPVGSRVRVYGVSRYDGQDNHNWYEVHPVLNIEVVKH
jgi:anti-sigma factor RsiW